MKQLCIKLGLLSGAHVAPIWRLYEKSNHHYLLLWLKLNGPFCSSPQSYFLKQNHSANPPRAQCSLGKPPRSPPPPVFTIDSKVLWICIQSARPCFFYFLYTVSKKIEVISVLQSFELCPKYPSLKSKASKKSSIPNDHSNNRTNHRTNHRPNHRPNHRANNHPNNHPSKQSFKQVAKQLLKQLFKKVVT